MNLMNLNESTGWRTEVLLLVGILLGLAIMADVATRYEFGTTTTVALELGAVGAQVLAMLTARARQSARKEAEIENGNEGWGP